MRSRSPRVSVRSLETLFRTALLAAAVPSAAAAILAGCGSTSSNGTSNDGGDCTGMCGCYQPVGGGKVTKPFTGRICSDVDGGDASSDAGLDASDGGANADASDDAGCLDSNQARNCALHCPNMASGVVSGYLQSCDFRVDDAGTEVVDCLYSPPPCGRRPEGLARSSEEITAGGPIGRYFADSARLEAASVHAFDILARELRSHGAPRSLVRKARAASRDEVRHARVMGTLARRHGASFRAPLAKTRSCRSLEEIARENVVEGCVRETYGALLATFQASNAADPAVRSAMRVIARDETRHAALAWEVARWADSKLATAARRRISAARCAALDELREEVLRSSGRDLQRLIGLPLPHQARALTNALSTLWQT
jgi:hypothetical protein